MVSSPFLGPPASAAIRVFDVRPGRARTSFFAERRSPGNPVKIRAVDWGRRAHARAGHVTTRAGGVAIAAWKRYFLRVMQVEGPRELEAHRAALNGHCYRMLGSAMD